MMGTQGSPFIFCVTPRKGGYIPPSIGGVDAREFIRIVLSVTEQVAGGLLTRIHQSTHSRRLAMAGAATRWAGSQPAAARGHHGVGDEAETDTRARDQAGATRRAG